MLELRLDMPSYRRALSGRLGVVTSGAALAGAAALVAIADPAAPGSRFPTCTFHQLTGLWCPGCGLTRGFHHLLRGDLLGALGSNVFTPFVALAIVVAWGGWALRSFGFGATRCAVSSGSTRIRWWAGAALIGLGVAYTVLRNLPVAPFDALAP